jgi:serine protease AprX
VFSAVALSFLRTCAAVAAWTLLLVSPSAAADEAVREAVAAGKTARVIMQFANAAERDAAFNRLLDRGAAVRAAETEAGSVLIVLGSAVMLSSEFGRATRVSLDASVTVNAVKPQARGNWIRPARAPYRPVDAARSGFSVAIIDSGIQPHADLPGRRVRYFKDFVSGSARPIDRCGHGTHVAGIVAGSGFRSNGAYAGIAPNVDIVALRVLGNDCSGNTSDVIDALEWVGRYHQIYNIRIVTLSLGHAVLESIFTDPLVQAVERLSRKGVAVVTAAGNKGINPATGNPGYGGVGVPCNAPSAICVGALDTQSTPANHDDRVSDSSSRGPTRFDLLAKPDLVAPGVDIVSLAAPNSRLFREYPQLRVMGGDGKIQYFRLSGTSMAAPAVAGTAALLLQQNSALTSNTIKLALQFTARLVPLTDVLTQGAGAMNVGGALALAAAIDPAAPRGGPWLRGPLTAANQDAYGQPIVWGQRIIYGDRFMRPRYAQVHLLRWDDDIVWAYDTVAENIVWRPAERNVRDHDDRVVWGNEENFAWADGDNIAWGNIEDYHVVWGNGETDNVVWGVPDDINWGHDDTIVWGDRADDNIVWGDSHLREVWASNVVWGFWDDNSVWGNVTRDDRSNIVWGNAAGSIVRGEAPRDRR